MFRKKEKLQSYINQVWRLFKVALVMMLVLAVVLGKRYLEADAKTTMSEQELDSSLLSLSEVYLPGTIYDKKDNVLMFGSEPGKLSWMSDKKSNSLERLIGGTDYIKAVETGNVRMTILGMAPELLGESDSRMDEKSLFHPNQRRIGGNVKLTIDADLQNFIEDLLIENGYMDSSVMVSNFQTGEVEAAVCLGGDSSETVFSRKFHPASTMKLATAASALEYDANLANFSYTCKGNNTFTLDAEGKETVSVHCSGGNVHGTLTTMESAMAQSCNGYFIALAQQVPEEILRKNLKKFLFIYSILYKPCIFKAYRLLNVQTLCIFPCFCPYEPKQGKFLFSADYLIQQSCGSTLRFPCSVSVNVHCGTDISVSEKFLHIFRCCTV